MSGSNIRAIVDYTAALAGTIQGVPMPSGTTAGVRATFGAGQGLYGDPLHPGQLIQPAPEDPAEAFTHFSDLPDAPSVEYITQSGLVQFEWSVPMRLFVPRGDPRTVRATVLPFYNAYEAAFVPDPTLGGLCLISYIKSFRFESPAEDDWCWLEIDLHVTEEVAY